MKTKNFDQFLADLVTRINPDAAFQLTYYPGEFVVWAQNNGASEKLVNELLDFFEIFNAEKGHTNVTRGKGGKLINVEYYGICNPPELEQLFSLMPENFKRLACDYAAADFKGLISINY